jgi:hypothetical protein
VENRLAERDDKGKRVWTLDALLDKGDEQRPADTGRFRSLKSWVKRKVKVSEDGIW